MFMALTLLFNAAVAVAPTLNSFELDMDAGTLTLTAAGVARLRLSNVDCTRFVLQNKEDVRVTTTYQPQTYRLTGCSSTVLSSAVIVRLSMTTTDLDKIKLNQQLAVSQSRSFISIDTNNGLVDDSSGDELESFSQNDAKLVSDFTADTTSPQLATKGFKDLDLDSGMVTLEFNEPIDVSTLNLTQTLQLQHHVTSGLPEQSYSIIDAVALSNDSHVIDIQLSPTALNELKLNRQVCTTISNCWLTFTQFFILDMAGNVVSPLLDGDLDTRRIPASFSNDITGPRLLLYDLDLDSGELIMTFDEPVDVSSLDATGITVQSMSHLSSISQLYYTLTDGMSMSSNGDIIEIQLSPTDLNEIKSRASLATSKANSFLSVTNTTISDLSVQINGMQTILSSSGLQVTSFYSDVTRPVLSSFDVDLNVHKLTLSFSEPVLVSTSFNLSKITLQSTTNGSQESLTITGGSIESDVKDGAQTVTFTLADSDIVALKQNQKLATSQGSTFLSASVGLVEDMSGNVMGLLPSSAALQVKSFIPNTTPPRLISFSLDIDSGVLSMTFDDVVAPSTFQPEAVTLQNSSQSYPLSKVSLTSGSRITSSNGFTIDVQISDDDLNEVKKVRTMATSIHNTFIVIGAHLIDSVTGVDALAITDGKGLQASDFKNDETRPTLTDFDLDVDAGILHLFFSETVDVRKFSQSTVSLQTGKTLSDNFTLSASGTLVPDNASPNVDINLDINDLTLVKKNEGLATHVNNTWLTISELTAVDMNGNRVVPLPNGNALNVRSFTEDLTQPVLTTFDLDLNTGVISLQFDEIVDASSFDVTQLTLVNHRNLITQKLSLVTSISSQVRLDIKSDVMPL